MEQVDLEYARRPDGTLRVDRSPQESRRPKAGPREASAGAAAAQGYRILLVGGPWRGSGDRRVSERLTVMARSKQPLKSLERSLSFSSKCKRLTPEESRRPLRRVSLKRRQIPLGAWISGKPLTYQNLGVRFARRCGSNGMLRRVESTRRSMAYHSLKLRPCSNQALTTWKSTTRPIPTRRTASLRGMGLLSSSGPKDRMDRSESSVPDGRRDENSGCIKNT